MKSFFFFAWTRRGGSEGGGEDEGRGKSREERSAAVSFESFKQSVLVHNSERRIAAIGTPGPTLAERD